MHNKTTFDNGVRVLSETLPHTRSISLGIWVDVGSRDESKALNGISHFIEHMIFKGTARRSTLDIARELDVLGGLSNAFTGKENTCVHARVLDRHFPQLADILTDIFLNSQFDALELDREKQVILQEIGMVEDTPDELVHVLFCSNCWPDHALGRSILGSDETVSAIDRERMRKFYVRHYTPERIIIAAAGNIDHDSLVGLFRPVFENLETGAAESPAPPPVLKPGFVCHEKSLEQVHVCIGGRAPDLASEKRLAGAMLNTILGGNMSSRLFQEIREKRGLAYSIYSFLSAYKDAGVLGVYMGTDPRSVNQALDVVRHEVMRLLEGDLERAEFDMMKEHLVGSILLGSESNDTRMMRLAKNEYVFGRYISYEELIERLNAVDIEDVIHVAEDCFKGGLTSVLLGPVRPGEVEEDLLSFPVRP